MTATNPALSDEQLMSAYVGGNPAAFQELFRRYAPRLLALVRRDLWSKREAEDIVQETFLHVHRARNDFREGAPLRPWVMTIALNLKREYFRRKGRRPEQPLELDGRSDPAVEPSNGEQQETAGLVREALSCIPEPQREVIELHWFQGLSFPEVATVLGASVSAVKVRAHRGYERLREALSEQGMKP